MEKCPVSPAGNSSGGRFTALNHARKAVKPLSSFFSLIILHHPPKKQGVHDSSCLRRMRGKF